jgi:hypothetical protein
VVPFGFKFHFKILHRPTYQPPGSFLCHALCRCSASMLVSTTYCHCPLPRCCMPLPPITQHQALGCRARAPCPSANANCATPYFSSFFSWFNSEAVVLPSASLRPRRLVTPPPSTQIASPGTALPFSPIVGDRSHSATPGFAKTSPPLAPHDESAPHAILP